MSQNPPRSPRSSKRYKSPRRGKPLESKTSSNPNLTIHKSAVVCHKLIQGEAEQIHILGEVEIGDGSILHPQCLIDATAGPIKIGENNIIEERVIIRNKTANPLIIGNYNRICASARIECKSIGDLNVIGSNAILPYGSIVDCGCDIAPGTYLVEGEEIEDNTILWGHSRQRRKKEDAQVVHKANIELLLGLLEKLLKKYHRMLHSK